MRGKQRRRVLLAVMGGLATVCSGVAVNRLTLDRASWPWWVAAVVMAVVATGIGLGAGGSARRTNRAAAEAGGRAHAGNRGRPVIGVEGPSNEARAVGPGSVAHAGDDYGDPRDASGIPRPPRGD